MTSDNGQDITILNTANHDADRDPIVSLLDRLGGDAALVRRTAFIQLRATAEPVDAASLAAECALTLREVEMALADLGGAGTIARSPAGAVVAAGGLSVVPATPRPTCSAMRNTSPPGAQTGDHEGATASLAELADIGKATWADLA